MEPDSLFPPDQRKRIHRQNDDDDTDPLSQRRSFIQKRHSNQDCGHRTGRSNRRRNGHGKMLDGKRGKNPGASRDYRLRRQQQMLIPRQWLNCHPRRWCIHLQQSLADHGRKIAKALSQHVEEQYRGDCVLLQRDLLGDLIESQEQR